MPLNASITSALQNSFVSSALMGVTAPLLIPKRVRPQFVRSDLMLGAVAGIGWYALWHMVERNKAAAPVNGLGNIFNRPWEVQQAFTGGRNRVNLDRVPPHSAPPARQSRRRFSYR